MDDTQKRRLSGSISNSSDDENSGFGRASFSMDTRSGLGSGKRRRSSVESFAEAEEESAQGNPSKKMKLDNNGSLSGMVQRMMAKMGYKEGVGLGKHGQGRLMPIQVSTQKGRLGLGYSNEDVLNAIRNWNPDDEEITIEEKVAWLGRERPETCTKEQLDQWMGIGPSKDTIHDETLFCDAEIVTQVMQLKTIFDKLGQTVLMSARSKSNPFETIRGAIFLNRAAVKMANMDSACKLELSSPPILGENELLYFADVCAGPGGFSEYILWRKKWRAKGFGFTLNNENDFRLEDFYAGPTESFYPVYGRKGDGNVYDPENQEWLRAMIMQQTKGKGVHLMMSDGGFSVEGQENIQEILSKQLYLCQCLVALMIVRKGGNFVTKLFDLFTPFSAGLVYLMYRCFDKISIFKPNTSRPANSERYLICKGKHGEVQDVIDYLARANRVILKKDKDYDVMELVPLHVLQDDASFCKYLRASNEEFGRNQIIGLTKIIAFCENPALVETRQAETRIQCLERWGLPNYGRFMPTIWAPKDFLAGVVSHASKKCLTMGYQKLTAANGDGTPHEPLDGFSAFLSIAPTELTTANVESTILNTPYDWFCMPCGAGGYQDEERAATFYIGLGKSKTYRYSKNRWCKVTNIVLPRSTLVYAELISELRGEFKRQRKTDALHILDAYYLGGEDVSQKSLEERHKLIKIFAESLWDPVRSNAPYIRVRAKQMYCVAKQLEESLNLNQCRMKNGRDALVHRPASDLTNYDNDGDEPYYILPNSVLFFKSTAIHWSRHMSRSSGQTYYFNCKNGENFYDRDRPPSADAAFEDSFHSRIIWHWPPDPALTIETLFQLIRNKRQPATT